jgi:hypothetical protein
MMMLVVDDFLDDPIRVRNSALAAGFGTWRPNRGEVGSSVYDGMCFWGDHGALLRKLSAAMGHPVYPNSMFFRSTNRYTEGAYVHSDREMGDYTAIVYLSKHVADGSGTGFYRHRATGMTEMPPLDEIRSNEQLKREMVEGSDEVWERYAFTPGNFNRCLIFEAPLFHARMPRHGYGATPEHGRMVWACHFTIGT